MRRHEHTTFSTKYRFAPYDPGSRKLALTPTPFLPRAPPTPPGERFEALNPIILSQHPPPPVVAPNSYPRSSILTWKPSGNSDYYLYVCAASCKQCQPRWLTQEPLEISDQRLSGADKSYTTSMPPFLSGNPSKKLRLLM